MAAFVIGLGFGLVLSAWWRTMKGRVFRALPAVAKVGLPIALALSAASIVFTPTGITMVLPLLAVIVVGIDISFLVSLAVRGTPAPK